MVPIRVLRVWLAKTISDSDDTNSETSYVGEHVSGVGHDGDWVGDVTTEYLNDHEHKADEYYAAQFCLSFPGMLKLLHELIILLYVHSVELSRPTFITGGVE